MANILFQTSLLLLLLAAIDGTYGSLLESEKQVATYDDSAKVRDVRQVAGCECTLTAYDSRHYGGRSLIVKQQNADFQNDYFDDRVESLAATGRCKWLLYQDSNFRGDTFLISPGRYPTPVQWGGSTGNRLTSARGLPLPGTDAIILFQGPEFRGRMLVLYGSQSRLPSLNFNDQLSSFIITGGRWTLYQHINYSGTRSTYGPGEYRTLPRGMPDDYISSVRKL